MRASSRSRSLQVLLSLPQSSRASRSLQRFRISFVRNLSTCSRLVHIKQNTTIQAHKKRRYGKFFRNTLRTPNHRSKIHNIIPITHEAVSQDNPAQAAASASLLSELRNQSRLHADRSEEIRMQPIRSISCDLLTTHISDSTPQILHCRHTICQHAHVPVQCVLSRHRFRAMW